MKSLSGLLLALYYFLVVCLFSFLTSCKKEYSGNKDCSEVSLNCELSKDCVIIKIIDSGNAVDAYGLPLKNDRWYSYSTKSAGLLELASGNPGEEVTVNDLNIILSGKKPGYILSEVGKSKSDTVSHFELRGKSGMSAQTVNKVILLETDGYFFYEEEDSGKGMNYEGLKK